MIQVRSVRPEDDPKVSTSVDTCPEREVLMRIHEHALGLIKTYEMSPEEAEKLAAQLLDFAARVKVRSVMAA